MLKKVFVLVLAASSLAGCVSSYEPSGLGGGYTDMALNKDTYLITFYGNGYTSTERTESYLLRRAAEVTLSKGYKYFVFNSHNNTLSFSNPGIITGLFANKMVKAEIKMLHSSEDYVQVYDAKVVLNNYKK